MIFETLMLTSSSSAASDFTGTLSSRRFSRATRTKSSPQTTSSTTATMRIWALKLKKNQIAWKDVGREVIGEYASGVDDSV